MRKTMTTHLGNIKVGDPVILIDAKDLGSYGFVKNIKGTCNALINVEGRKLLYFQPSYAKEVYVIDAERCILDQEALDKTVPIEDTINVNDASTD